MMPLLITLLCINAVVGIALATALLVFRCQFSLKHWIKDSGTFDPPGEPPVTVVIAARNEQNSVAHTLQQFSCL